eukprot:jgi/Psemu1/51866/gm1.51866_g
MKIIGKVFKGPTINFLNHKELVTDKEMTKLEPPPLLGGAYKLGSHNGLVSSWECPNIPQDSPTPHKSCLGKRDCGVMFKCPAVKDCLRDCARGQDIRVISSFRYDPFQVNKLSVYTLECSQNVIPVFCFLESLWVLFQTKQVIKQGIIQIFHGYDQKSVQNWLPEALSMPSSLTPDPFTTYNSIVSAYDLGQGVNCPRVNLTAYTSISSCPHLQSFGEPGEAPIHEESTKSNDDWLSQADKQGMLAMRGSVLYLTQLLQVLVLVPPGGLVQFTACLQAI